MVANAAQIAAAALDRPDGRGAASHGVDHLLLGTGIAAAEVGDVEVRAEQIRAVAQDFQGIGGSGVIPKAGDERCCNWPGGKAKLQFYSKNYTILTNPGPKLC